MQRLLGEIGLMAVLCPNQSAQSQFRLTVATFHKTIPLKF